MYLVSVKTPAGEPIMDSYAIDSQGALTVAFTHVLTGLNVVIGSTLVDGILWRSPKATDAHVECVRSLIAKACRVALDSAADQGWPV